VPQIVLVSSSNYPSETAHVQLREVLCCAFVILALIGAANARNNPHVADADREYAAIFSHAEKPCAKESTTIDYEECIGKEVEFTENHLNAFLGAVRGILTKEYGATAASDWLAR
jgi:hypothetical protein